MREASNSWCTFISPHSKIVVPGEFAAPWRDHLSEQTMSEVWRPVRETCGYEVSSLGRVRSLDRVVRYIDGRTNFRPGQILKLSMSSGYPAVNIKGRRRRVHVLVAETFHGPRPNGLECCHRDDDRTNNRADNLYWGTHAQNLKDASENGKMPIGEDHPSRKLTIELVEHIIERLDQGESQSSIARSLSIGQTTVSAIKNGKIWGKALQLAQVSRAA